ncbi:MAG: hypothetical protein CMM59_14725 [Rhodospirillaceae bacterium]|nr:hypothetical protein [Rhodospirillaceae bacterium]|tara:strand:- start:237 stop:482 length:246 start_codon:yes stop_codon:yes gene_type:complete
MKRVIAIVLAANLVSGCGLPAAVQVASLAIDEISLATTEKTASDHVISVAADKDCALFRSLQGKKICLDEELTAAEGTGDQ